MMNEMCKYHKLWLSMSLFSAIIQKPMEKSYWVFIKGTRVMLKVARKKINTTSSYVKQCLGNFRPS